MRQIDHPEVRLVTSPEIDWNEIRSFLKEVGGGAPNWIKKAQSAGLSDGESIVEFAGRLCYNSYVPGLNPNVKRIREDSADYLHNIISSQHGSVLEHINYGFIFSGVSRVFTHEMVRHRAGVAVSQESMRFVRLNDIPFWEPNWATQDEELIQRSEKILNDLEDHQNWMAEHFKLDEDGVPFSEKKAKTSYMRRFAPDGVATSIFCTINVRALRHIIYMRTAEGAEEEIRYVFDKVAHIMQSKTPELFSDMKVNEKGEWKFDYEKV